MAASSELRCSGGYSLHENIYWEFILPNSLKNFLFWRGTMLNIFLKRKKKPSNSFNKQESKTMPEKDKIEIELSAELSDNYAELKKIFLKCSDINFRELTIGKQQIPCLIILTQGLVDDDIVNKSIIKPLMELSHIEMEQPNIDVIRKTCIQIGDIQEFTLFKDMLEAILTGDTVLLIDGVSTGIKMDTKGWPKRAISEPVTETVVKGPRDGFTEDITENIALLRRKIKTTNLKIEDYIFGNITKTSVKISYLEGIVNEKLVDEVKSRIERIDVDAILESNYIEELIEDSPSTLFPLIESTERPDKIAASLLEGRIAIFVDGSCFVLILPVLLVQLIHTSEDYYQRFQFATAVRLVRYAAAVVALLLPAIYVALVSYHFELIPTALLISIAGSREGVPFPGYIEALMMELTFEALREAGIRLPRAVGQAVSIVGALVIGQSAVEAGMVSPAMVIVVAVTGIASFTIPSYSLSFAIRILRFGMLFLSTLLGFYGIMLGLLALMIHLASLRSFGVPYLSPIAPFKMQDMKDIFYRSPWWAMEDRPNLLGMNNSRRQKFFLKPRLPKTK